MTNSNFPDTWFGPKIPFDTLKLPVSAPIWVTDALGIPHYTDWYRQLFRSPDIGDANGNWIARMSVNGSRDIVAYVLDSAKHLNSSAPAGSVAVRELIQVTGLTRYSAILENCFKTMTVEGLELSSLRRLLEDHCLGHTLGRPTIALLRLNNVTSDVVRDRTHLRVMGTFQLRQPTFPDNLPPLLTLPAMDFRVEDKRGRVRVNAFCLNVLAQELFGTLMAEIKDLSQAANADPAPSVQVLAPPEPTSETTGELQAAKLPRFPIDFDDPRLQVIRFFKHREVLVQWNLGEMSNKEINAFLNRTGRRYVDEAGVTTLISRLRNQHPVFLSSESGPI